LYLKKLEEMEMFFRGMELPQTREEFESRAALLQLMKEMERYLLLKHSFKGLPKLTNNRMKKRHLA
ncbi:aromatic acid exporter family protein, partial [Peribacillus sp. NPDC060186]